MRPPDTPLLSLLHTCPYMCCSLCIVIRRAGLSAARTSLEGCTTNDLIVVTDFDLTLTAGGSDQCHDLLGAAAQMPEPLRAAFSPLLDFSKPFPLELQGDGWWVRANEILMSEGKGVRELLPTIVANSQLTPRPGALDLLRRLVEQRIPVLIVSAGFCNVIEAWLEAHGIVCPDDLLRVSSNRIQFSQAGDVARVEPHPPMTSLNKGETFGRNHDWFDKHASRSKLIVMGDRLNDLKVAEGAPPRMTCLGVGICNDAQSSAIETPIEKYCEYFDVVVCGDQGSLAPVLQLIDELC